MISVLPTDDDRELEHWRALLIDAAVAAYENAGLSGLCHEGRWECALAALRRTPLPMARPEDRS